MGHAPAISLLRVLVLLPPSETKAAGGDGAPLDLAELSFPELNPVRAKVADALVELAADLPASLAALGISARQEAEVDRNRALFAGIGSVTQTSLDLADAAVVGHVLPFLLPARNSNGHPMVGIYGRLAAGALARPCGSGARLARQVQLGLIVVTDREGRFAEETVGLGQTAVIG